MGLSDLNERIGKFFLALGALCGICVGLFRMCKASVGMIKDKIKTTQEAPVAEEQNAQETSQK